MTFKNIMTKVVIAHYYHFIFYHNVFKITKIILKFMERFHIFIKRLSKSSASYLLYLRKGLNSLSLVFEEDTPYKLVTRCGRQCNGRASASRSKGREVPIP